MQIKAVVFDFDGTLTKQGSIDFNKIKDKIHCPEHIQILDFIESLDEKDKGKSREILDRIEYEAAELSQEEEYVSEVLTYLQQKKIPIVILTRNSKIAILRSLKNFRTTSVENFHRIISRDDPFPVKPDPTALLHIAEDLNITPEEILIVGDYIHDIETGINGGCKTVYKITNRENDHLVQSDFKINSLSELIPIFQRFLVGENENKK